MACEYPVTSRYFGIRTTISECQQGVLYGREHFFMMMFFLSPRDIIYFWIFKLFYHRVLYGKKSPENMLYFMLCTRRIFLRAL